MPTLVDSSYRLPGPRALWFCSLVSLSVTACGDDDGGRSGADASTRDAALPSAEGAADDSNADDSSADDSSADESSRDESSSGDSSADDANADDANTDDAEPRLDAGAPQRDASSPNAEGGSERPLEAGMEQPADAALPSLDADQGSGARIAGKIVVREQLVVDVDADPSREAATHNDVLDTANAELDAAQPLPSPAWAIGYLGPMPGKLAGPVSGDPSLTDAAAPSAVLDGALQLDGDNVDYYRLSLERGDAVTLFVHEAGLAPRADLDLYLLDRQRADLSLGGSWVKDSIGTGEIEQVIAPADGEYWLAVHRFLDADSDPSAAATYALTVGVPVGTLARQVIAQSRLSSDQDVVPGQALVRLPFGPRSSALSSLIHPTAAARLDGSLRVEVRGKRFGAALDALATRPRAGTAPAADRRELAFALKRLRRDPEVLSADPVLRVRPQGLELPADPDFALQWPLWSSNVPAGWDQSERAELDAEGGDVASRALGAGVVVAVLDTGIALDHPDFVRADGTSQILADGHDMILDEDSAGDGDSRDTDPTDEGDGVGSGGGSFHGTHVAGTIAAAWNNATGIAGVAPDAKILPLRVIGRAGGNLLDVEDAILYAAGLPNDTGRLPARRADIISMSFAGVGRSERIAAAIQAATDAGCIVIASAGNDGAPAEEYTPVGEPGVIGVSAVDARFQLTPYSNFGAGDGVIALSAPGGDLSRDDTLDNIRDGIWGPIFKNDGADLYGLMEGTSMAAAQVAGIAALMKGVWPEMTPAQFRQLLPELVVDLGPPGEDRFFGHGAIDAARAVAAAARAAENPPTPRPLVQISPRSFDFWYDYDALHFDVLDVGDAELVLDGIDVDVPWLAVERQGVGPNRLLLDRWGPELPTGSSQASLELESNAGPLVVPVRVFRESTLPAGDVGALHVFLVDGQSGEVVAEQTITAGDAYEFAFDDVAPGTYRVLATTNASADEGAPAFSARAPFADRVLCVGPPEATAPCADVELEQLVAAVALHP